MTRKRNVATSADANGDQYCRSFRFGFRYGWPLGSCLEREPSQTAF